VSIHFNIDKQTNQAQIHQKVPDNKPIISHLTQPHEYQGPTQGSLYDHYLSEPADLLQNMAASDCVDHLSLRVVLALPLPSVSTGTFYHV